MYSFLYYYIYSIGAKRKNPSANYNASLLVFLAQLGHIVLIIDLFSEILGFKVPVFSNDYSINRLSYFPFCIIWIFLLNKYYDKRFRSIHEKYQNEEMLNIQNSLLAVCLIVLPYAIGIYIAVHKK